MAGVALDISGQDNHGEYLGGVRGSASLLPLDPDGAAFFDGSTGYVDVDAVIADLAGSTGFAMGCWAQIKGTGGDRALMIINKISGDNNRFLLQSAFTVASGHFELNVAAAGGGSAALLTEPGNPHAPGVPVFVVANCGTSNQSLYTNGNLVASANGAGQTIGATDRASIGQDYDSPTATSAHWPGVLDDAFIIPRKLTAGEIAALYTAATVDGTFRESVLALGPIGYWRLNEFAGGWFIGQIPL